MGMLPVCCPEDQGLHPEQDKPMLAAMKVLIAASGSRGDFQPLLALALALRKRGHEPLLAATPNFASEAESFGLPFVGVGQDVQVMLREHRAELESRNPFAMFGS